MFKFFLTALFCVMALTLTSSAFASDGSSIHSTLARDHMLTPWNS